MIALLLVALALGLSNFAAAIGIGISGSSARTRLRVGIIFGLFETGMPVAGLALGRGLAQALGSTARWISAGLLIAIGAWTLAQAVRTGTQPPAPAPGNLQPAPAPGSLQPAPAPGSLQPAPATGDQRAWRLILTGLAISVDNLAVGFALSTLHVSLAIAAITIGAISVALSLAGLELGAQVGARAGRRGELLGGIVLIAVGAAIAAGVI